jgi:hypothetical protein
MKVGLTSILPSTFLLILTRVCIPADRLLNGEISGSHGGGYKDESILGYSAV